jgi:hypothetical protein
MRQTIIAIVKGAGTSIVARKTRFSQRWRAVCPDFPVLRYRNAAIAVSA